jgi:riboflavin synthase
MFTGIVREKGRIAAVERIPGGVRLRIRAQESLQGMRPGDSIAVNGACLTVVAVDGISFSIEAMEQTLGRTTVGSWTVGDLVNLENPLSANDRLGGHVVTGHVDGVGLIRAKVSRAGDVLMRIQVPRELMVQVYERSSVAVDGVSLTVVTVQEDQLSVILIPHTMKVTTLESLQVGDEVNLETDMIVKAVQRILNPRLKSPGLTRKRLQELGF